MTAKKDNLKSRMILASLVVWLSCLGLVAAEGAGETGADPFLEISPILERKAMLGIWASPQGDFVSVGLGGTILSGNRKGWTKASMANPDHLSRSLRDVWGNNSNDFFVVSSKGRVFHYDGQTWQILFQCNQALSEIWGSSASDVFVVGAEGTILHFDGVEWSSMESGVYSDIINIHGSSPTNVYATTKDSTLIRYDGKCWSNVSEIPTMYLQSVWVASSGAVFLGGSRAIVSFNGLEWSSISFEDALRDIAGISADEVYGITSRHGVIRFDGEKWSQFSKLPEGFHPRKLAVNSLGEIAILGFVQDEHSSNLGISTIYHYIPEESRFEEAP